VFSLYILYDLCVYLYAAGCALVAELHLADDLDATDAAEIARRIVPLQEPADATAHLTATSGYMFTTYGCNVKNTPRHWREFPRSLNVGQCQYVQLQFLRVLTVG